MSKLLERIREDQLEARKNRATFKATLLTTLLGEASPSGNDTTTDDKVEKVVAKFVKNAKETMSYTKDRNTLIDKQKEIDIYERYLPEQLTEAQLRNKITHLISMGNDNIGKIMGILKQEHKGQFDGKTASVLIKELL